MRYVVHDRAAAVRVASSSVLLGAVFVAVVWFVFGHHAQAAVVGVVFTGVAALGGFRAARAVVIDRDGVALTPVRPGRRLPQRHLVAWPHVLRVEVERVTGVVRVVLRHDAPLPDWVRGRVYDPTDPEAGVRVEQAVPHLDAAGLERAVRVHAPRVPVIHR